MTARVSQIVLQVLRSPPPQPTRRVSQTVAQSLGSVPTARPKTNVIDTFETQIATQLPPFYAPFSALPYTKTATTGGRFRFAFLGPDQVLGGIVVPQYSPVWYADAVAFQSDSTPELIETSTGSLMTPAERIDLGVAGGGSDTAGSPDSCFVGSQFYLRGAAGGFFSGQQPTPIAVPVAITNESGLGTSFFGDLGPITFNLQMVPGLISDLINVPGLSTPPQLPGSGFVIDALTNLLFSIIDGDPLFYLTICGYSSKDATYGQNVVGVPAFCTIVYNGDKFIWQLPSNLTVGVTPETSVPIPVPGLTFFEGEPRILADSKTSYYFYSNPASGIGPCQFYSGDNGQDSPQFNSRNYRLFRVGLDNTNADTAFRAACVSGQPNGAQNAEFFLFNFPKSDALGGYGQAIIMVDKFWQTWRYIVPIATTADIAAQLASSEWQLGIDSANGIFLGPASAGNQSAIYSGTMTAGNPAAPPSPTNNMNVQPGRGTPPVISVPGCQPCSPNDGPVIW
jgi:hypothetical protein